MASARRKSPRLVFREKEESLEKLREPAKEKEVSRKPKF